MGPQPEGKTDDSEKPDRAAAEQVPYAICDVTATLEIVLNRKGFTKMADGLGYYWHNSPLNAYIEVLPLIMIQNMLKKYNMRK